MATYTSSEMSHSTSFRIRKLSKTAARSCHIICELAQKTMVVVKQPTGISGRANSFRFRQTQLLTLSAVLVLLFIGRSVLFNTTSKSPSPSWTNADDRQLRTERVNRPNRPQSVAIVLEDESKWARQESKTKTQVSCSYQSLQDLAATELYPKQGDRHMVNPPSGGKLSLVCCTTTAGPLNIVAHHKWAPLGAERFMAMVTSGYFNSTVPLMRCLKGFLCQFGLNSDNSKNKDFQQTIADDPNWLPEGPSGRQNEQGVKRFAQGYLAYAGSGKHSRNKQLIVALQPNGPLAGGSPWEVPWGEIVHQESFDTLGKIFTGYGENGPPQGKLGKNGMTPEMKSQWPDLDYIQNCELVDERELDDNLSYQESFAYEQEEMHLQI